ncbi:hypothetical protein HPP92_007192 [Vanilla planifolia]|uniref:Bifunctional inhibitor/plant lipid transfer protein/seed storage helical domain-containing protein n=1 Tax=Vanilla planifolia TaxID=51239 RepID=A0A835V7H1_VANPL|nr:hypothetical protein HPP92_007192 [Vanilla planifolia]
MALKVAATAALFFCLNVLSISLVGSCGTCPCPRDALKLGVCADVLGLINLNLGKPPKVPCCALLEGLVDLEAAVCLCTALKANILGINLNLPINLSLVLNYCGQGVPAGFQCA